MTYPLLSAAILATTLDGLAYLALITTGQAIERNPLVAAMSTPAAILARLLLLVVLAALAVASEQIRRPALTVVVRVALALAVVVGVVGASATFGSVS